MAGSSAALLRAEFWTFAPGRPRDRKSPAEVQTFPSDLFFQKAPTMSDCSQEQDDNEPNSGELDEDEILATLSPEELKQLQNEMEVLDPDPLVPLGQRQRDHTEKAPTGSFDHRSLIDYLYWEKESSRLLEEERIPVILLNSETVEGRTEEPPAEKECEEEKSKSERDRDKEEESTKHLNGNGQRIQQDNKLENKEIKYKSEKEKETLEMMKAQQVKDLPVIEPELQTEDNGSNQLEGSGKTIPDQPNDQPKIEDPILLCNKTEACSSTEEQVECNNNKKGSEEEISTLPKESQENTEGKPRKGKVGKKVGLDSSFLKLTARPSGNPTLLDESLADIRNNKPDLKEVNLNNVENIPKDMLKSFVEALKKNKHVTSFSITNTGADDEIAFAIANMLRENKKIVTLNIESNFITGKGIVAIMRCLQFNEILTELRFHNQRHMLGHHAEMEIARLLKANTTLLKLGYHFELPGPRMVVTNLLSRNLDQQRQRRLEQQRNQVVQEQELMMNACQKINPGLLEMVDGYVPNHSTLCEEPPLPPNTYYNRPKKIVRVQLRKIPKKQSKIKTCTTDGNDKPNLKAMLKSLKPVPRTRQAPLVENTPRDLLLNDIRQSNVAYLKPVPLPKLLS
ncbi:leiomodin-3 isoform X2 [Chiloscyllium punctatum]|uniref:leiomodin-3 isoform X2 n=1 Tax=Chiloscyllium punctatum TaxID=137246 RepID=UPI003B6395A0